jgi:hypothetical protein
MLPSWSRFMFGGSRTIMLLEMLSDFLRMLDSGV